MLRSADWDALFVAGKGPPGRQNAYPPTRGVFCCNVTGPGIGARPRRGRDQFDRRHRLG